MKHIDEYGTGGSVLDATQFADVWPGDGGELWLAQSDAYLELLEACERGDGEKAAAASEETYAAAERFREWVEDLGGDYMEYLDHYDS